MNSLQRSIHRLGEVLLAVGALALGLGLIAGLVAILVVAGEILIRLVR